MKIGIIGAMMTEIEWLKAKLSKMQTLQKGAFIFYHGYLNDTEVIILLSGIGKVSAAVGTSLLIECYNPDYIINTGTAGGLANCTLNDLIVGEQIAYHDVDLRVFGYTCGQMAQMPEQFTSDNHLIETALRVFNSLPYKKGLILSGDSFMSEVKRVAETKDRFPNGLAVDMEAAAIAQVCYQLGKPFIVLRTISDMAGEENSVTYDTFVKQAGEKSAQYVEKLIANL